MEARAVNRVFAGLLVGRFMSTLSVTSVAPALPRIVAELGSIELYSWIIVATLVSSTVVVPIAGKLSDLYGRRWIYLAGVTVFVGGSLVCGLAPGVAVLIIGRLLQGVGLGMLEPLAHAIIGDTISPRDRGKYLGYIGLTSGVSAIVGPVVGGLLTDIASWRLLFFVNVPVGLVALVVVARYLHIDREPREPHIDWGGMMTFSLGLTALVLATVLGGTRLPWTSPALLALASAAVVSLVVFAIIERRVREPIVPPHLWRSGAFTWSMVAIFAVSILTYGTVYFAPLFMQRVLGTTATASGSILVPESLALIVANFASGRIVSRTGRYKPVMLLGSVVMAITLLFLSRLDAESGVLLLGTVIAVNGLGIGCITQLFPIVVQNAVPRRDLGAASASMNLFGSVGRSIGFAGLGAVLAAGVANVDAPAAAYAGAIDNIFLILTGFAVLAVAAIALLPELSLSAVAGAKRAEAVVPIDAV